MARHAEEAKQIVEAFEMLSEACENIKGYEQCENCPLQSTCLEDTDEPPRELFEVGKYKITEFLEYSEKAEISEADRKAAYADFMRKYEQEERWIEDYDG